MQNIKKISAKLCNAGWNLEGYADGWASDCLVHRDGDRTTVVFYEEDEETYGVEKYNDDDMESHEDFHTLEEALVFAGVEL